MVQSIGGSSGASGASGADRSQYQQAQTDALGAVAQELGLSSSALQSELQSGQTLTQIAASKGVSSTDLQNTIEAALKKDLPNATATQLQNLTSRIANGHHGHHAHGAHGSSSSADASGAGTGPSLESELLQSPSGAGSASGAYSVYT